MKKILILFLVILFINDLSAQKYTEKYIKDANNIALEWWNQANNKKYEQTYNKLSDVLKKRATLESWISQMGLLMQEFGTLESRKVKETYFQSELEGFKDGFYVVVEYDVKYSKTKNHTENIILRQSDKLEWEIFDFNYTFQDKEKSEEL
jgi:hypothetical protein